MLPAAINFSARKFTEKWAKYEPKSRFPIDQIAMIYNWLIDYYMLQSTLVLENLPKNVQM